MLAADIIWRRLGVATILTWSIAFLGRSEAAEVTAVADRTSLELAIDDPRPMAKAIRMLTSQYGYAITYEDPRYVYESDIQDVTNNVRKDLHLFASGNAPKVLGPRGGSLNVNYTVLATTGEPENTTTLLRDLLASHAALDIGGIFRLTQTEGIFHVIPARIRDGTGAWIDQESILDAAISVPAAHRTAMEFLQAICTALSDATGQRVEVGLVPINYFVRHSIQDGAEKEVARDVLVRMLKGMDRKLTWMIYYGPGTLRYTFNIGVLDDPTTRPKMAIPLRHNPADRGAATPSTATPLLRR